MKKFFKVFMTILLTILVIGNTYVNIDNNRVNGLLVKAQEEAQMLQNLYNEINVQRNILLEEKFDRDDDNMEVYLGALENKFDLLNLENKNELNKIKMDNLDRNIDAVKMYTTIIEIQSNMPKEESKPSFEYLKSVTVRIQQLTDRGVAVGTGSIVKITEDFTYILTNRHVATLGTDNITVEKNGKTYKAVILKNGIVRDLSLIRIVGKIPNTSVVKGFAKTKEQNKIYSVGMYKAMYNIYTQGTVAGWTSDGSRLINMPALHGCSGSGVFDKDGNMVAVVWAGTQYTMFGAMDTAKAWCVPYIAIVAFLEEIL